MTRLLRVTWVVPGMYLVAAATVRIGVRMRMFINELKTMQKWPSSDVR